MSTRTLITAATAVLLAACLSAQTNPPAQPEPATPAVQVDGAQPTQGTATRDKDTLSVDFPDEDIKTILRNVADLFELNLVVPDTLTGKASIKLRDVTWRQIFQVVLSPVGYTYIEEGNIIKIVSNEAVNMEPVSTEVFILNNAKAQDIKPTVDGLVDAAAGGKILIDSRSNALVITERPTRMTRVRTIIEQLDKATAQVMIESKFVEVTDRDIRNIGVNWASLQGMQFGVRNISQTWNKGADQTRTNGNNTTNGTSNNRTQTSSTTSGTSGSTSQSNNVTYNLVPDVINPNTGAFGPSTQLTLPAGTANPASTTVTAYPGVPGFTPASVDGDGNVTPMSFTAPVTSTTTTSSGTTNGTSLSDVVSNSASSAVNSLLGLANSNTQSRLATAVFSASDFNIIVSALKTQNNTKIVSNPTVVTLNNTEATLNIGQEFPVPSYTYNSERGTFEVSGFQYKPIGVILRVTPQVNAQGTIRLALEPEVSQQNGSTTFGGAGGASIPIIATRKVKTQISLKDGYTAGIGGLISQSKDHGGSKVPVLGSVPVLGRLFSSKNVNDSTTNLLIFITAKTVNPDGAAPSDVFQPAALESVGMTPGSK
jgi:type II secretory pathway component GspD/PulD (secretin)